MFQLTKDECLGSQIATLNEGPSQIPYFPTGRPFGGFSLTLTNTACPTRPYYVTKFQKINANTLISEICHSRGPARELNTHGTSPIRK